MGLFLLLLLLLQSAAPTLPLLLQPPLHLRLGIPDVPVGVLQAGQTVLSGEKNHKIELCPFLFRENSFLNKTIPRLSPTFSSSILSDGKQLS